jgi:hypothetical protein
MKSSRAGLPLPRRNLPGVQEEFDVRTGFNELTRKAPKNKRRHPQTEVKCKKPNPETSEPDSERFLKSGSRRKFVERYYRKQSSSGRRPRSRSLERALAARLGNTTQYNSSSPRRVRLARHSSDSGDDFELLEINSISNRILHQTRAPPLEIILPNKSEQLDDNSDHSSSPTSQCHKLQLLLSQQQAANKYLQEEVLRLTQEQASALESINVGNHEVISHHVHKLVSDQAQQIRMLIIDKKDQHLQIKKLTISNSHLQRVVQNLASIRHATEECLNRIEFHHLQREVKLSEAEAMLSSLQHISTTSAGRMVENMCAKHAELVRLYENLLAKQKLDHKIAATKLNASALHASEANALLTKQFQTQRINGERMLRGKAIAEQELELLRTRHNQQYGRANVLFIRFFLRKELAWLSRSWRKWRNESVRQPVDIEHDFGQSFCDQDAKATQVEIEALAFLRNLTSNSLSSSDRSEKAVDFRDVFGDSPDISSGGEASSRIRYLYICVIFHIVYF